MIKNILLLTDYRGYIPQLVTDRESISVEKIKDILENHGHNVVLKKYSELELDRENYHGFVVIYASSQAPAYKDYIEDYLTLLKDQGAVLIPDYKFMKAHEDKLMQSLIMDRINLPYPETSKIGTLEEGESVLDQKSFPIVAKFARGYGSKTVRELTNKKEGLEFLRKHLKKDYEAQKLSLIKRLYFRYKYGKPYSEGVGKVIFQEKIPDLTHDWKILVFNDKLFALKRYVRENGFKASGSGKFSFDDEPPDTVLDLALESRKEMDVPWLSVDIVESEKTNYVIEFQAIHFGMYTYMNSEHYYSKVDGEWVMKSKDTTNVAAILTYSLMDYLEGRN